MKSIWAKNYADNLSEEIRKGHREKIEQMRYPGPVKFGYKSIGDKRKDHIIDPVKAPLLKHCFDLYSSGKYTIDQLCIKSKDIGLLNKKNNPISKSRMHEILTDPFYCGEFIWNGVKTNGIHEPIVTKEQFQKVKSILHRNQDAKYLKHFYLFQGKVNCTDCNSIIAWYAKKGHVYGRCNHFKECNQKICTREDRAEESIYMILEDFKLKDEKLKDWIIESLIEKNRSETDTTIISRKELMDQFNKKELMIDEAYRDKLKHLITQEKYEKLISELKNEQDEIQEKIKNFSSNLNKQRDLSIHIFNLVTQGREIYSVASDYYKRTLINIIFEKLILKDGKLEMLLREGFDELLEDIKMTNSSKVVNSTNFENKNFEPSNFLNVSDLNSPLYIKSSVIRREQDSNLRVGCPTTVFPGLRTRPTMRPLH